MIRKDGDFKNKTFSTLNEVKIKLGMCMVDDQLDRLTHIMVSDLYMDANGNVFPNPRSA